MKMSQKGFITILIAAIVLIGGVILFYPFPFLCERLEGGFDTIVSCGNYFNKIQNSIRGLPPETPTPSGFPGTTLPLQDETANWKTYKNDTYSFEVKYPSDWISQGYWSENGGFFYVGFGDENAISTKPPAMLRIYPNQSSIDTFKNKVYFQGNWKNTTLGGLPAFETVGMDQTTKRQFVTIVSIKGSYGYELESTVFDDTVDIVRTMSSTFKFLK